MRRFLPQTRPAWILSVLIGGLLLSQIATFAIVSLDRTAANEVLELFQLSERAVSVVKLLSATPNVDNRKQIAAALSNSNHALTISQNPVVASAIAPDDSLAELSDVMIGQLARFGVIDARVRHDMAGTPDTAASGGQTSGLDAGNVERELLSLAASFAESKKLTASIQFADGTWLNLIMAVAPVEPILNRNSLPLYVVVALLIVAMSAWSIHRLTGPYRLLEEAVTRIGGDLKSPPVPEEGSREYRAAARAINAMQAKLRVYVEDREQLAAALAHDLRTPLTRMRLRMEKFSESAPRTELMHDIREIESIARSVVDFATLEVADEEPELIDFGSLVYAIADGYDAVSFDGEPPRSRSMVCHARPVALKRCLTNLFDNAIAYGKKLHLSLIQSDRHIGLVMLDEGPGIPEEQLDAVLRPFVRVEKSRNRSTGGIGLGLTIANNIARSLGGEIRLSNGEHGGLRAELLLPRSA